MINQKSKNYSTYFSKKNIKKNNTNNLTFLKVS